VAALPIVISFLALAVSVTTAWLTFLRSGRLRMTQPTVIFFGPDGGPSPRRKARPMKVFLRTLLYSTARRGQTLESLHVNLQRGESKQNFSIWVYGPSHDLARGSGLFVPMEGVAANHHFLLPDDGAEFRFLAGEYTLRVFAKTVSSGTPETLAVIRLRISDAHAQDLRDQNTGIYFDWGPDQQAYHPHTEQRVPPSLEALMDLANQ
jgi:hypothetical protein